jgi:adenine-specific DNA-methyltransferase
MNDLETKRGIENSLKSFAGRPIVDAATAFFESLGYKSQKRIVLKPNTPKTFTETFAKDKPLSPDHALLADWQSVDFLFQLTDDEVRAAAGGGNQQFLFEAHGRWNGAEINSFLFLAVTLTKPHYTRTELSGITRAVNRLFPMPAILLFRHGDTLTLAVIPRRLHKRDESRDVLEKVTLIKDIRFASPHRAHVEILADLSFDALYEKHAFTHFVALQAAWQKALDSSELNKRFFQEIANWYFWALDHAEFPKDAPKQNGKDHISVIRLITRLMFCWFVKEKRLIPDTLFDERKLAQALKGFAPTKTSDKESVFYKAILQNLFFATLNTEMDKRAWRKDDNNFMAHILYRHRALFQNSNDALDLFKDIPFLNGGLFECLDKREGTKESPKDVRIDGFSDRKDSQPTVPDFLFFGAEREVDLREYYGDKKFQQVKVRGLIHIFDHYKFTIAENTPIEEEIALDPELSGKVFENLLAAYNPETGASARKQSGSFYTPREIVNYMVDEALIAYLKTKLETALPSAKDVEARLRHLFAYTAEPHKFTPQEVDVLIAAIDTLKSLDPAVGSGAFPMGILHKLVFILRKLDPRNEKWKERQIARVRDTMATAEKIEDATARERAVRELEQQITGINEAFEHNELDYGRKLYLIENCIYGVDIQPIAVQIAKMRFFISLIVDQKIDDAQPNRGVRPLPNLETKFVAANTLIDVERKERQGDLLTEDTAAHQKLKDLRQQLVAVRHRHFLARTPTSKAKCRDQDRDLREKMSGLLRSAGLSAAQSRQLAGWNPYDQNASADFFDAGWMFGITDGFDVATGNPPYGAEFSEDHKELLKKRFDHIVERIRNSFLYFMGASFDIIKPSGVVCFILPNEFLFQIYMTKVRRFFLDNARFMFAINVGEDVFDAIVPTCIVSLQKHQSGSYEMPIADLRGCSLEELPERLNTPLFQRTPVESVRSAPNSIFSFDVRSASLVNRLSSQFVPFEKFCDDIANGISTGCDGVYIISAEKAEHERFEEPFCKPCIRGGQFNRFFCPKETGDRLLYVTSDFDTKRGKRILEYLSGNKPLLIRKSVEKKAGNRDWHILFRSRYEDLFRKPKILLRQTGDSIIAAVDDEAGFYCIDSVNVALVKRQFIAKIWYLTGLLNSRLLNFFYREISQEAGRVLAQVKPQRIRVLPIAEAKQEVESAITKLVMQIVRVKAKQSNGDTSALEREIDQQIYALYGLAPEEIKIVEEASA